MGSRSFGWQATQVVTFILPGAPETSQRRYSSYCIRYIIDEAPAVESVAAARAFGLRAQSIRTEKFHFAT
jgi:hypothetical protein